MINTEIKFTNCLFPLSNATHDLTDFKMAFDTMEMHMVIGAIRSIFRIMSTLKLLIGQENGAIICILIENYDDLPTPIEFFTLLHS